MLLPIIFGLIISAILASIGVPFPITFIILIVGWYLIAYKQ